MTKQIRTLKENIKSIYFTPITKTDYKWYPELPSYWEREFLFFVSKIPKIDAGWDTQEDSREYNWTWWEDGRKTETELKDMHLFFKDGVWYRKANVEIIWVEGTNRMGRTYRFETDEEAKEFIQEVETECGREMMNIK